MSNPFATRYFRPGAIEYWPTPSCSVQTLISRWQDHGRQGLIVGPHGSGKSTLLQSVRHELTADREHVVHHITLTTGRPRPRVATELRSAAKTATRCPTTILIDGLEQMAWLRRRQVRLICKRNHWGLLATAHRGLSRLPVLAQLQLDPNLARQVVTHLLGGKYPDFLNQLDFRQLCHHHNCNMREILFDLYDQFARIKP